MKLLFCSANPRKDLDLVTELERVLDGIDPKAWHFIPLHDVTPQGLIEAMRVEGPDLVHFCGHSSTDELMFVNSAGDAQSISPQTFAKIFRKGRPPKAIILNSCENLAVLGQLRGAADWGIGTTREVGDDECIRFSQRFYNRLSENKDIQDAYNYAHRGLSVEARPKFRLLNLRQDKERDMRRPTAITLSIIILALIVATAYSVSQVIALRSEVISLRRQLADTNTGLATVRDQTQFLNYESNKGDIRRPRLTLPDGSNMHFTKEGVEIWPPEGSGRPVRYIKPNP